MAGRLGGDEVAQRDHVTQQRLRLGVGVGLGLELGLGLGLGY